MTLPISDTFTDADGRRFIAGARVPEQVWQRFEAAYLAPSPSQPTAGARILRTIVQVVLAVAAAIPATLAAVPIPSKYDGHVALVIGIAGACVIFVTAVQNGLEAAGKLRTALTPSTATVPTDNVVQPPPPAASGDITPGG